MCAFFLSIGVAIVGCYICQCISIGRDNDLGGFDVALEYYTHLIQSSKSNATRKKNEYRIIFKIGNRIRRCL